MNLPLFQGRRLLDLMLVSFAVCMIISFIFRRKTSMPIAVRSVAPRLSGNEANQKKPGARKVRHTSLRDPKEKLTTLIAVSRKLLGF